MTVDSDTRKEMPKAYNPAAVERRLYERWEKAGYFAPRAGGEPYTIVMPPPNLTGELHLGHAMMDTVEDILIRWRRMQCRTALWLNGVGQAVCAVHSLVETEPKTDVL